MKKQHKIITIFLIFIGNILLQAQFAITNPLNTADATGLVIGNSAFLTAARGIDPNGDGFLRLTEAKTNQKGYMYVQASFPTTSGILADFEYKIWREVAENTYFGADGFTVFLFDGNVTDANFKLGGFGGSLGYATYSNPANTPGLSGGYVGIGFDEYGNYSTNTEQRNGGSATLVPNAVVLRGPSTATLTTSNVFLASAILGDRTGNVNDIRKRDEIDYNTTTPTRPTDATFYRRVQVIITKLTNNNYNIVVRWKKQGQTAYTQLLTYEISSVTYPLPATLKLGFAAATGGGFNNHEIRNILLTTPGNLRVDSRVDNSIGCKSTKTPFTFNIEVTNDGITNLTDINFQNRIENTAGTLLDTSQFTITSVTTTGFTTSNISPVPPSTNEITGKVGLPAGSAGIVTIKGNYNRNSLKTNTKIISVSKVSSTQLPSEDNLTLNKTARSEVNIRNCGVISNPSLPSKPQ